jgi:small subunit ribosomal protein S6
MRRYETIVILDSDLSEEERSPVIDRVKELIPQYNGFLITIDEWGLKRLAYEIKKKPRGYYALLDFCGHGHLVDELERSFRIDDRVLKYMTVLLEKDADTESIKAEIAEREAREAERKLAEEESKSVAEEEPRAEPEPVAESEPTAESEPVSESEPLPEPEPVGEPEPAPEPEEAMAPSETADEETAEPTEISKEE